MALTRKIKITGLTGADLILGLAIVAIILALSACFWGWIFMLIAGACGWHVGFFPIAFFIGLGISLVAG